MKLIESVFDYQSFMPHGYCFLWIPEVLWSQIIAEVTIALAYFLISIGLVYLVSRRKDMPFSWIVYLFATFIFLCGLTHAVGLITIWYPVYVLDSIVKIITAAVSIAAAFVLFPLIPRLLEVFEEVISREEDKRGNKPE